MPVWFSMLDETGFYAPSMAHNTLPCRPWQDISGFHVVKRPAKREKFLCQKS